MKYKAILAAALAMAASAFLVGCGGGGGGSGTPATPTKATSTEIFPLRAAYTSTFNNSRSLTFTLSGTTAGVAVTGSGTVTQGNVMSSVFEGANALVKTSTVTGTVTAKGVSIPLATTSTSYVDSNYAPKGSQSSNEYSVVSGLANIPLTGKVNDTGLLYSENRYSTSAKASLLGTRTKTFVMEPDTATTALLKIIDTDRNTSGTTTATSTANFRISTSGALTRLFETYLSGADNLTMTY